MEPLNYKIRDFRPEDLNFVLNSWLQSYWYPFYRRRLGLRREFPRNTYFRIMEGRIKELIGDGAGIQVACNPELEDQIFGWMFAARGIVYYVFVKNPFRRQGIARKLLEVHFGENPEEIICGSWTSKEPPQKPFIYIGVP